LTERRYKHHRAPITPFAWACVVSFAFICLACIAVAVWLFVELSK
jgi:hypothetical protein